MTCQRIINYLSKTNENFFPENFIYYFKHPENFVSKNLVKIEYKLANMLEIFSSALISEPPLIII